jgi:isochorismate pyruvate lyase
MVVTMIAAPDDCRGLDEVRAGIDAVDDELVALLARRMRYVERAAQLKPAAGVAAHVPERRRQVMLRVDAAARRAGLAPDLAAALWNAIIDWATVHEEELMAQPASNSGTAKSTTGTRAP